VPPVSLWPLQFKLLMNWNQEELDQWSVAQQQKEEDNQALDKYKRQDEGKLQQLSLAVEKLTQQVAAQRAALDAEITDTQVCNWVTAGNHAVGYSKQTHSPGLTELPL
jgi:hypothetical protein